MTVAPFGVVVVTEPGALIVIVGGIASTNTTVTAAVAVAVLLAPSVAVHVIVCEPTLSAVPEAGEQLTPTGPLTESVALALYSTGAPEGEEAVTVPGATIEIDGAVVSTTFTTAVPEPVFPSESVAVHVIVVLPSANVSPEDRSHAAVRSESTSSVTDAVNETTAPAPDVASTVAGALTVTTGSVGA